MDKKQLSETDIRTKFVTTAIVGATREIPLDQFPSPDELWNRYCLAQGLTDRQIAVTTQDYYDDGSQKSPR